MSDLISVVVPIYNIENYLEYCVLSICGQTYENLEIILVNDGSTDGCGRICDDFAKRDKRIKVVHKKNGGLSEARNYGIDASSGKYIAFIDGDDFIDPNMFSFLYNKLKECKADISGCVLKKVYNHKIEKLESIEDKPSIAMNSTQALEALFLSKIFSWVSVCNKLFSIEIFKSNDIKFPLHKFSEDAFTIYKLFFYSTTVVYTDIALYYYFQREGSITRSPFNRNKLDHLVAMCEAVGFINAKCPSLKEQVERYYITNCIYMIDVILRTGTDAEIKIAKDISKYKISAMSPLRNRYLSKKRKLSIILLRIDIRLYALILKVVRSIKANNR